MGTSRTRLIRISRRTLHLTLITGLLVAGLLNGDALWGQAPALQECQEHIRYGAPSHDGIILCRAGYVLSYNTQNKVADWVAYHLTAERLTGQVAPRLKSAWEIE